jgi:hypothetical protein
MSELIPGGPVERYLDELFDRLAGCGAAGRRSLAEAEDHLRAASASAIEAGLSPEAAEQSAADRFGSPASIGAELRTTYRDGRRTLRQLFVGAWWIGLIGLLAVGVSGLLSELSGRLFGPGFVAGDAPGVTYTPARCAQYQALFSHPMTCRAAATADHWGEVVDARVAMGVLGLLVLGAWLLARRIFAQTSWRPQVVLVALVTTALFGLAAVVLLGPALMKLAFGMRDGLGASIADGTVAATVALVAALFGVRPARLRRPTAAG